jgi:hypothetical protein
MFESQYNDEMEAEVKRLEAQMRANEAGHPEWVNAWGDENQRKYGFILPITLCCFTSIWQAIKHHHVRVRNG